MTTTSKPLVFVSHRLPGTAVDRLRDVATVIVGEGDQAFADPRFREAAPHVEAVVTLLTARVDEALLAQCPKLRLVANVAVGVDNVDVAACRRRNVVVTHTPGVLTDATADLAFGLLLAAARRIAEGDRFVRAGRFEGFRPTLLLGTGLSGQTLGIVGLGRIGQAVARRAAGFGMRVVYSQRHAAPKATEEKLGAKFVKLDDLFVMSDFVSLHCPLTEETRHLVSRDRLGLMKPGAILVNTARGPCVDEEALAEALERGPLAGAALDVFEREPFIAERLLARPNVVFTPHIASAEIATREAMASMASEEVVALLRGQLPIHPLPV